MVKGWHIHAQLPSLTLPLPVPLQELVSDQQAEAEESLGNLVDEELASTAHAVESAAQRIQEMLRKSREDDTGVKLEVNERLLDSCTGLMKAIKVLIARSKDLQGEILGESMVSVYVCMYCDFVCLYVLAW